MSTACHKCQHAIELPKEANIPRTETCPRCMTDLRVCKMCFFYDPQSYNECRESSAERIVEKEKANYCDYFKLGNGDNSQNSVDKIKDLANSLFKN